MTDLPAPLTVLRETRQRTRRVVKRRLESVPIRISMLGAVSCKGVFNIIAPFKKQPSKTKAECLVVAGGRGVLGNGESCSKVVDVLPR